jgi:hypothetical protein
MNLAPTIILVPYPVPVMGSSFPRVIGERFGRTGKTPPGWPLRQELPTREAKQMLDSARRELAETRARKLLNELEKA